MHASTHFTSLTLNKTWFDGENFARFSVIRISKMYAQAEIYPYVTSRPFSGQFVFHFESPSRSPVMCVRKSNRDNGVIRLIKGLNASDNLKCMTDFFKFYLWINLLEKIISQNFVWYVCTLTHYKICNEQEAHGPNLTPEKHVLAINKFEQCVEYTKQLLSSPLGIRAYGPSF